MGKVKYGLSDVHYAILDTEKLSYSTAKSIPGAVNLSIDPEGDSTKFYADDGAYASFDVNAGYSGDLEIATIPDDVYTELLGFITGSEGELIETSDLTEVHFGFSFRIKTNQGKSIAFRYYNCTLSRPSQEHKTMEDSTEPATDTMSITFLPLTLADGTSVVKSHKEMTNAEATTWVSSLTLPTIQSA